MEESLAYLWSSADGATDEQHHQLVGRSVTHTGECGGVTKELTLSIAPILGAESADRPEASGIEIGLNKIAAHRAQCHEAKFHFWWRECGAVVVSMTQTSLRQLWAAAHRQHRLCARRLAILGQFLDSGERGLESASGRAPQHT